MTSSDEIPETKKRILLALADSNECAQSALRKVMENDYPMDRVSLLGRASSSGDDPIGIYYGSAGDRMKGWGKLGAFWGGLWGLLSGAVGIFLLPGLGPVMAAGPLVESLTGAAAGAGVGGGAMAGAGGLSYFTVAVHRLGIPEEEIERIESHVQNNGYVLMLLVAEDEVRTWRNVLEDAAVREVSVYPYVKVTHAMKEKLT